jgi:hypothetical protein
MAKNEVESSRLDGNHSFGIFGSLQFVLEHGQQDDWFNNKLIVLLSRFCIWIYTIHLATVDL